MKQLSYLLRRIWCGWFFLIGFLSFLPLYPLFLITLSRESWFKYAFRLKKVWAHCIIFSTGIFYKIKFESKIDKNQAYVICPNHSSYLDIVLTNIVFPNYFHFMGKAELLHIPLLNIFFKRMNIAVNRSSITDSHKAFKRAASDLSKGISLAIFPEATIPSCAPELGPFKNGAFKLAIEKQVPIVPITYLDNWSIFPDGKGCRYLVRPGLSRVIVHTPIPTIGMTEADATDLRKKVYDVLNDTLNKYGTIKKSCKI